MKVFKTILFIVIFLALSVSTVIYASAASDYSEYTPEVAASGHAKAYYVYNTDYDTVISVKNPDMKICPASAVKVMTGLIACEKLGDSPDMKITVTKTMAAEFRGYSMHLTAGETVTVTDMLYAAICGSYNDAAIVLAHTIAGSTSGFLALMNSRAAELGMTDTVYTDITGISSGTDTTARDIAKSAYAAQKNMLYMQICSARKYDMPATDKHDAFTFHNRNALVYDATSGIYYNEKCHGMSSGFTDEGGWCLVTVTEWEGIHYLCVVLGADEDSSRVYSYVVANQLIKTAYSSYGVRSLTDSGKVLAKLPVNGADRLSKNVALIPGGEVKAFVPVTDGISDLITYDVRLEASSLDAPVKSGLTVGSVVVSIDGQELGRMPVVVSEDVNGNIFYTVIGGISSYISSRTFAATAVTALLLLLLYFIFMFPHRPTKKHHVREYGDVKRRKLR